MKRVMLLLLSVCLLLGLTACEQTPATPPTPALTEPSFTAIVTDVQDDTVTVMPLEGEDERRSADRITFSRAALDPLYLVYGDAVCIAYDGQIMESYPAQIHASVMEPIHELSDIIFPLSWVDPATAEATDPFTADVIITAVYKDCFFAEYVTPHPYRIKVNTPLPEGWCLNDQVSLSIHNVRQDDNFRIEADLESITESTFVIDPNACYKPVIYLYPEETTDVDVTLELKGELTCTYPAYKDGWRVTAAPDGTLTDAAGQTYRYLYWEGNVTADWAYSEGFCVKGEDTAAFLETALEALGLNRREANEFIVYWLPQMQENPYNLITFQTDVYTEAAALHVSPTPDTVIRVFMVYKPLGEAVTVPPQTLTAPARDGFTVVEWGGAQGQ